MVTSDEEPNLRQLEDENGDSTVTIPKKSLAIVPLFVVITLIGLWLLAAYLRSLREGPKSELG